MGILKYLPLLKIIFTVGVVLYLLKILNFQLLWSGIQQLSLQTLIAAFMFCFLSIFFQATRWYFLTKKQMATTFWQQTLLFWRANFLNLISPASLGGDVYRVAVSHKNSITLGLILRERLIGLWGFCVCYLFFFAWSFEKLPPFFLNIAILCGIGFIGLLLLQILFPLFLTKFSIAKIKNEAWQQRLLSLAQATKYITLVEFLQIFILTILSIISWAMVYYYLMNTSSLHDMQTAGLNSIIVEISRWIPATIQGIGIREGVSTYAFQLLGYTGEIGFLVAGLAYLMNNLVLILLGAIGFLTNSLKSYSEVKNTI